MEPASHASNMIQTYDFNPESPDFQSMSGDV